MAELYLRRVRLTLGTTRYEDLRIVFTVRRTRKPDPNTATITVYNLSAKSRTALQDAKTIPTRLEAGYGNDLGQIFLGELRNAVSRREGPDWITTMETGDGEESFRTARINKSFKSVNLEQIVQELADTMGVGLGNAIEKAREGKFADAVTELSNGVVLNGRSSQQMTRVLDAAGLEWSIQDGQLQVLEPGKALELDAVVLTPATGLLGSPDLGERGRIECTSLLQPTIIPGRIIRVDSKQVSGDFVADVVEHDGDNRGQRFETMVEGVPL